MSGVASARPTCPVLDVASKPQAALTPLNGGFREVPVPRAIDADSASGRETQQRRHTCRVDEIVGVDGFGHESTVVDALQLTWQSWRIPTSEDGGPGAARTARGLAGTYSEVTTWMTLRRLSRALGGPTPDPTRRWPGVPECQHL